MRLAKFEGRFLFQEYRPANEGIEVKYEVMPMRMAAAKGKKKLKNKNHRQDLQSTARCRKAYSMHLASAGGRGWPLGLCHLALARLLRRQHEGDLILVEQGTEILLLPIARG